MTEQSIQISVRDVIDLYKINKSIDMANESIKVRIHNKSINLDLFIQYIHHLTNLGYKIFITYIDPDIRNNIESKNINTYNYYDDIITNTMALNIEMNNANEYIYSSLFDIYIYIRRLNITPNYEELCNAIRYIFKLIITIVKNKLIKNSFDKSDKSDILHIIDADINFDYEDFNIIKQNLLCEIFFKNIYNLINSYDNKTFDIKTIIKELNNEITELDSCKLKLLAISIRDACINNNLSNIKDKFDFIKAINDLNKFKEIDTIYTYEDTKHKHTDYNLKYISYRRTKQYIEYDKNQEINFNIPVNYLEWYSSSCYMDIIVFSLLYKKNKFISNIFLNKPFEKYFILNDAINNKLNIYYNTLKIKLNEIYEYIHTTNKKPNINVGNIESKDKLRNILSNIHEIFINEKYYLFKNKNVYDTIIDLLLNYKLSNSDGSEVERSPEYNLHNFVLILFNIFQLNELITIKKSDIIGYDITLNISENNTNILPTLFIDNDGDDITILKSKLLVLNNDNNRIYNTDKYIKIYPPPYLKLEYNTELIYLQSIIIHYITGNDKGHYICLFNNNSIWYEYDDTEVNTKPQYKPPEIGTLDDIINNSNYNEHIAMLIYY